MKTYLNAVKSLFSDRPNYLIQYVTARCPARCKMCFYWDEIANATKHKELSVNELRSISKSFGNLQQVTLTGGEPFLRADLPEIVRIYDKQNQASFISIPTSSLVLDRTRDSVKEMLKTTNNSHLVICISLDALGKDHDEIRAVPGCFDKVVANYENMARLKKDVKNFHIKINMTISSFNHSKVEEVAEFVLKEMPMAAFNFNFVRGNAMDPKSKDIGLPEYQRVVQIAREKHNHMLEDFALSKVVKAISSTTYEIIEDRIRTNERHLPCTAGSRMVVVSEEGVVKPCEILGKEFGNLRDFDYDISKVLQQAENQEVCSYIKDKKCSCTFENAILNSTVTYPSMWPRVAKNLVRNELSKSAPAH
jgi:MoaA/NifB/PqqE/SkfB family radical SAM enzyme